jgi:hypothetical protein
VAATEDDSFRTGAQIQCEGNKDIGPRLKMKNMIEHLYLEKAHTIYKTDFFH